MTQQYEVKITNLAGVLQLTYTHGQLTTASSTVEELTIEQHTWLWSWIPLTTDDIAKAMDNPKLAQKLTITPTEHRIKFEEFWEAYDYKIGKKARVQKLWDGLTCSDQHAAIRAITRYNSWLATRNVERLYPETYLAQRRFENKF